MSTALITLELCQQLASQADAGHTIAELSHEHDIPEHIVRRMLDRGRGIERQKPPKQEDLEPLPLEPRLSPWEKLKNDTAWRNYQRRLAEAAELTARVEQLERLLQERTAETVVDAEAVETEAVDQHEDAREHYDKEAAKRMKSGKASDPVENLPQGKARDEVGKTVGVSGKTFQGLTDRPKTRVPSPKLIARRTAKIRRGWSEEEAARREAVLV